MGNDQSLSCLYYNPDRISEGLDVCFHRFIIKYFNGEPYFGRKLKCRQKRTENIEREKYRKVKIPKEKNIERLKYRRLKMSTGNNVERGKYRRLDVNDY